MVTVCVDAEGSGAGLAETDEEACGAEGGEPGEFCCWVQTSARAANATPTAAAATHIALETCLSAGGGGMGGDFDY